MPDIVTLHEKHGDRVFAYEEGWELKVVTMRLKDGWYENWNDGCPDNQWKDRAEAIVVAGDHEDAEQFIYDREDFEYESFSIDTLQTL